MLGNENKRSARSSPKARAVKTIDTQSEKAHKKERAQKAPRKHKRKGYKMAKQKKERPSLARATKILATGEGDAIRVIAKLFNATEKGVADMAEFEAFKATKEKGSDLSQQVPSKT